MNQSLGILSMLDISSINDTKPIVKYEFQTKSVKE